MNVITHFTNITRQMQYGVTSHLNVVSTVCRNQFSHKRDALMNLTVYPYDSAYFEMRERISKES